MDRMNSVKEEDKMALSWENNLTIMKADIAKLARSMIENGHTDPGVAMDSIVRASPQMSGDKLFKSLFPVVFRIEMCKAKKSIN